jgi:formate C-acetyltransferase
MSVDLRPQEAADVHPFAPLSARIHRFRNASLDRARRGQPSPRQANLTRAFFELYAQRPFWERYARAMAYALENEPVYLLPDERLVGMLYQIPPVPAVQDTANEALWEPYSCWAQTRRRQEQEIEPYLRVGGAPGHVGSRWEWILERGVEGYMQLIREHLSAAMDRRARRLYRGALILWESVLRWNDRHVAALREAAQRASGPERERLEGLISVCTRVPRHPARTFHEAVQSFYMQHLALMFENPFGGNGPGRLDYLLWPYLERDLARDSITMGEAKELIDELFIRFHERLYHGDGWVEAVMVGGVRPDGTSSVNPLSHMMVQSIGSLDQTHPSVYMRISRDNPEDWVDAAVQYLLHGHNRAQIYNDDACLPAIVKSGIPIEDAAMYMAGGCMEISPQGMNSDLNFSCTHNVAKTLELVLNGGVDLLDGARRIPLERSLAEYATFDELYASFEAELSREYRKMAGALDIASECYARFRPCYLLSSLVDDCLDRGREQQDGGARYHDYGFAPLGITSAADALAAIKRAVFDARRVTPQEMLAALRTNYEGFESLRMQLAGLPRFGVEDAEADWMCGHVMRSVCTAATQQRTRFGGKLKPMVFNFVWTPGASRELGARADGTRAGELIGHGMTPRSCAMTRGITAAMNSCTSLSYDCVSGGATTMWDMDEQWISFDLMKAILRRFLAGGGMIFQGNTTSVRELEDAFEHPEKYPNLIVRVGGFSARFTTLDRDLQREIIARRRHSG